jgi:hypothetical protein
LAEPQHIEGYVKYSGARIQNSEYFLF